MSEEDIHNPADALVAAGLARLYRGTLIPIISGGSDEDDNADDDGAGVASIPLDSLPEKFRSDPSKFPEAYLNLEREYHQSRQQAKALEENFSTLSAQLEELSANQRPQQDPNDARQQIAEQVGLEPEAFDLMVRLAQEAARAERAQYEQQYQPQQQATAEVVAVQADQLLGAEIPDWNAYKAKVGEAIEQNKWLLPQEALSSPYTTAERLKAVYKMVKADDLLSGDPQQQQAAFSSELMKQQAQTMTGAAARPSTPQDDAAHWKLVKAARPQTYYDG